MAGNCSDYYRDQITNFIHDKVEVKGATRTDKQIFIPVGKGNIRNLFTAQSLAQKYSNEINERFQGYKVTSVDRTLTNGARINIHVPFELLRQYNLKQEEVEWRVDENNFDIDYFAPEDNVTPVRPDFTRFAEFQTKLINNIKNRINTLKRSKTDDTLSKQQLKDIIKEEARLSDILEGNEDSPGLITRMEALQHISTLDEFSFYLEKDFERFKQLIQSTNLEDIEEAKKLRAFFEDIGDFDPRRDHMLFNKEELYDSDGNVQIGPETKARFEDYAKQAKDIGNKFYLNEKATITKTINNNSRVQNTFKDEKFDYRELFFEDGGLKDVKWVDMFLMDVTNGIFSHNGIVPQVMMSILQDSIERNLVKAKEIENDVNGIVDDLEKTIKSMPEYNLLRVGKGISYDLFRATDQYGNYKDAVIQRYNETYKKKYNKVQSDFYKLFNDFIISKDKETLRKAYIVRNLWHRKNSYVMDLGTVPEIQEAFPEFKGHFSTSKYKENLIKEIGENAYKEFVENQKKLIKNYKQNHENFIDNLLVEESKEDVAQLSPEGKYKLERWEKTNNPFVFAEAYSKDLSAEGTMKFNSRIPRKNLMKKVGNKFVETNESTGYWDGNFQKIDENETLKKFHDIIMKFRSTILDALPVEIKERFNQNSIPALEKTIMELLFDKNNTFQFSDGKKLMYNKIGSIFGENVMEEMSYNETDPVTGKKTYKVNDSFLKTNKNDIDLRANVEIERIKSLVGISVKDRFNSRDEYNINNNTELQKVLVEISGEKNFQSLTNKYKDQNFKALELGSFVKSLITHQVVLEKSFDLPKMLKMFSFLAMEYVGRREALPMITMLKDHYSEIKQPETTKEGKPVFNIRRNTTALEGQRSNAIKQMDNWFERAVLGNYTSKNELGETRIRRNARLFKSVPEDEKKWFHKMLGGTITGKILDKDEKLFKAKIEDIEKKLVEEIKNSTEEEQDFLKKRLEYLQKNKEKLGKEFTLNKTMDSIFNFIRFKGLGYNLSSSVTNFMEGQTANFITASSGHYFTPENIYRANDIVKGSFLKNISWGKIASPESRKLSVLMARYRVLQDTSNELQKASTKSAFTSFKNLSPYELTRRTEYLNQSPLLICIMLDQKVIGKDGTESNIWDALDAEGKLLENFATEDNINNWEKANGTTYNDMKSKVVKAIDNTHGDYNQLRGTMANEYMTGKALLMFKRWMGRQFYQRFAMTPQADIEAGIQEYKGRYFSHTAASGTAQGALIGFGGLAMLGAGPLGLIIGSGVGVALGKFYGANSGMGFMRESAFLLKELFMNLLRIPINSITGKSTIKSGAYDKLLGEEFSERDLKNYRANLVDMSLTLGWIALLLFTKGLLYDDDDEEDSTKRQIHNLFANRFMQLSSQATMYLDPAETWKNTMGNVAIMKFANDVGKTFFELGDALEGKDIIAGGPNAGESAFYNQFEKTFIPGVFKTGIGFEAQTQREFIPSKFNDWFKSQDKLDELSVRRIRAEYKTELIDSGMDRGSVQKAVYKKYRPFNKKKDKTYGNLLKEFERQNQR